MGLISAAGAAISGTLADQWVEFFTAPVFDEQTVIAPGVFHQGPGARRGRSGNVITDGSRVAVPENTAVIITDGDGIVSVSTEPGYFVFRNDGQPSIFAGSGLWRSIVMQSWERFKYGGQPAQQQLIYYVNLREIRNLRFGTPRPMPYMDFSLVQPGSAQAPVLRVKAYGTYSVRAVDPIRFFRNFLPANALSYTLADDATRSQLSQEFVTAFAAALQSLSQTVGIASLATHGPEIAVALTKDGGPGRSWLERFGLEVVGVAVAAIDYDQESRAVMDKYNRGVLLQGGVGNAYTQTTLADAAVAAAESGEGSAGLVGLAMGIGSMGGTMAGLTQQTAPAESASPAHRSEPGSADPLAALQQLKTMLDQGLITQDHYSAKQQEILDRM